MACCPFGPNHYLIQDWLIVNWTLVFHTLENLFSKCRLQSIWRPGPWFNIKMTSCQYRKSHCGDKTILRPSYLHNGISYTGKMTSLYWIRSYWFCFNELTSPWHPQRRTSTHVPSKCEQNLEHAIHILCPADDVIITSLWRQSDVATSFW